MADFPTLRTGAAAQYPVTTERSYATEVFRFVDGSEQRCRRHGAMLRRWVVRLDLLDDAELQRLAQFFRDERGSAGSFRFTDPVDGTVYANCSLDSDEVDFGMAGEGRGAAALVIRENRV